MAELIDREKAIEAVWGNIWLGNCEKGIVQTVLKKLPTVDAAEVVHGYNTYDHNSAFCCSVCGFDDWDTMTADTGKYNYCPNCGAKMDGGKGDG